MTSPIHIKHFTIPESLPPDEIAALSAQLSSPEQERFKAITHPRRQAEYLLGHTALRQLAAKILKINSDQLPLVFVEGMKPIIQGLPVDRPLFVSLTHSHEKGAVVAAPFPIGIDLEIIRERTYLNEIVAREFSAAEAQNFETVTETHLRIEKFAAHWALKEALYKAASFSYADVFRKTAFEIGENLTVTVSESVLPLENWKFRLEKVEGNYYQALAFEGSDLREV